MAANNPKKADTTPTEFRVATGQYYSWKLQDWDERAPQVYPHTYRAAHYLVRANRRALVKAKAIARVGRDIVIRGAEYSAWLEKMGRRVEKYDITTTKKESNT